MKRLSTRRDEDGSALVLALVLVSIIGLMLTVVIDFAGTGMRATSTHNGIREASYAVDGAVEAAISDVRRRGAAGAEGAPCPAYDPPVNADGLDLLVECEPLPGSGGVFDDQPPFAILMVGDGAGEGINSIASGGSNLTIDGSIYTRGSVSLPDNNSNDHLTVYGDITSFKECAPKNANGTYRKISTIGGLPDCGRGSAADDGRWNLGYQPVAASAPVTVDPKPNCTVEPNALVWFPGTYTEVPSQPSGCGKTTWWFKPGAYYFDFPAGADLWNVDAQKVKIIGGTPSGTWTSPEGCLQGIDPTSGAEYAGVQFVFGGTSRLSNGSQGSIELCASGTASNKQKIALYGLDAGARSAAPPSTLQDDAAVAPAGGHAPASNLAAIDSKSGLKTFVGAGSSTVDYDFPDIPAGARVTKATMRIVHGEVQDDLLDANLPIVADKNDVKVEVTIPGMAKQTLTNCGPVECTQSVDLLSALGAAYQYQKLNDLTALVQVIHSPNGQNPLPAISAINGIALDVEYVPIGYQRFCDTCTLLSSTVNQNLFFAGTVYAPTGGFDFVVNAWTTTVFRRGIIGRTLVVRLSNSSKQSDAPFQLPLANPAPRRVLFTGYEVVGAVKTVRLRAVVKYTDSRLVSGKPLAFPGFRADVESWSVVRPD